MKLSYQSLAMCDADFWVYFCVGDRACNSKCWGRNNVFGVSLGHELWALPLSVIINASEIGNDS